MPNQAVGRIRSRKGLAGPSRHLDQRFRFRHCKRVFEVEDSGVLLWPKAIRSQGGDLLETGVKLPLLLYEFAKRFRPMEVE